MVNTDTVRYRGRKRDGTGTTGAVDLVDVAEWVRARFDQGWRDLTVTSGGEEVGAIYQSLDDGRRTWWGLRDVHAEARDGGGDPATAWKTIHSRPVYTTRRLDVRQDVVIQPDGRTGVYDHVVLPGSVTVLAVDGGGLVAVTEAGDKDPLYAAQRELAEEVGAVAGAWYELGVVHGADVATNHVDHLFLAGRLTMGHRALEPSEGDVTIEWMTFDRVLRLVRDGEMPHAGSTAAVLFAARRPELRELVAAAGDTTNRTAG